MKPWMRLSLILVIAIAALGVGIGATLRARAEVTPTFRVIDCQVDFLDGPQQGSTEAVTFSLWSTDMMIAYADSYVGGQSESGSWAFNSQGTAIAFTFSAQLVPIPGATLAVNTTMPVSQTTVTGPASGTITDSSGNVLQTIDANTTCPLFLPPPPPVG